MGEDLHEKAKRAGQRFPHVEMRAVRCLSCGRRVAPAGLLKGRCIDCRPFSWKRSPSELKYGVDRYIITVDHGSSMAAMST